jgi:hypothetical protein
MTDIETSKCGRYIKQGDLFYVRQTVYRSVYGHIYKHCMTFSKDTPIEQMISAYANLPSIGAMNND